MSEKLEVIITADDRASGVVKGLTGSLGGLGKIVSGGLMAGLAVATAGIVALGAGTSFAVGEAMEAQAVQAQLGAVLRSTGGIAGVSTDMANELAESYSRLTGQSDEAILSSENLLLTFTNIGKDIFPEVTSLTLDLAQALKMDLGSASIMLGKAMNEPVMGVTALRRAGVQLSEQQGELVESFMAVGDVASAQTIILEELRREVGGSAEAFGKTFPGMLQIFKNEIDNTGEAVGMMFLPVLTDLFEMLSGPLLSAMQWVRDAAAELGERYALFTMNLEAGVNPISAFRNAIIDLIPPFAREAVSGLFDALRNLELSLAATAPAAGGYGKTIADMFINLMVKDIPKAIDLSGKAINWLANMWREHGPMIVKVLGEIAKFTADALFVKLPAAAEGLGSAMGSVARIFNQSMRGITTDSGQHLTGIAAMMYSAGQAIPEGLAKGIQSNPRAVEQAISAVIDAALRVVKSKLGISSPSAVFAQIGQQSMAGYAIGIQQNAGLPAGAAAMAAQGTVMSSDSSFHNYGTLNFDVREKTTFFDILRQARTMGGAI